MKLLPCILVLTFTSASALLAQGGQPPPRIILQALDTDGDGQLSASEIEAASASLLKLDRNHDGQLTPEEYSPKLEDKTATSDLLKRLMALDRDGDGVLTKDELPERMQAMFDRGDTNHDGKLTADEIKAMSAAQTDPQGPPVGKGKADGNLRMDPVMDALDVNHDGILSAAEIASAPGALKTLDKDGDGTLSREELRVNQPTARQRAQHQMEEWDTNQDGVLTRNELPDRMQPQFEAIDLNHDGKIDLEEATTYFATQTQNGPAGGPGARTGERQGPPRERMPQNDSPASPAANPQPSSSPQ